MGVTHKMQLHLCAKIFIDMYIYECIHSYSSPKIANIGVKIGKPNVPRMGPSQLHLLAMFHSLPPCRIITIL